jgi:protein translocase SecG subunit
MFQIFFTIVSVLLVVVILLQQKSSALGSMMGAVSGDEMVQTRRGADKVLHYATVLLALSFAGGGLAVMMWPEFL